MTAASSAVHRRHRKGSLGGCWKGGPVVSFYFFIVNPPSFWMAFPKFLDGFSQVFGWIFPDCLENKRPLPIDIERRLHPQRFQHQFPPPKIQVADAGKGRQTRQMPNGNWCNTRPTRQPAEESKKEGDDVQGVVGTWNNLETYPK